MNASLNGVKTHGKEKEEEEEIIPLKADNSSRSLDFPFPLFRNFAKA
ncbi:MAG: hypothetical protein V1881_00600 [Candidatus Micrarchaeota archaeon]